MRERVASFGEGVLRSVSELGELTMLMGSLFRALPRLHRTVHLTVVQMMEVGIGSLPLVVVTSFFTGGVAAVQAAYQFQSWIPDRFVGAVVGRSVLIELGPVLTGLVVGGRVGASIAAELGTMKVTEQIDALEALGIDSTRYLVMPRFVAGAIMIPVITIFADFLAIVGGWIASVGSLGMSSQIYVGGLRLFFEISDIWSGLIKSIVFGMIIATMGCYYGLQTDGGAEGVGKAATRAVVASCLLILISDYVLAEFLFSWLFAR